MSRIMGATYRLFNLLAPMLLLACGGGGSGASRVAEDTSPQQTPDLAPSEDAVVAQWRSNMVVFGKHHCDESTLNELSTWEGSVWYYDGIRIYQQIAEYTGDRSFLTCANYVKNVYRRYVLESEGRVPGWRVFTTGLTRDYLLTGEAESRDAVVALTSNSAFATQGGGESFELSRETAYLILAYLDLEVLTGTRSPLLPVAVQYARSHIKQWLTSAPYVKPFMVALTAEALLRYSQATGDRSVLSDLPALAQWIKSNAWDPSARALYYIVCRDTSASPECAPDTAVPAPDLNLLIAPLFPYAAQISGDSGLTSFGDSVFAGGVNGAYLTGGKQFSQNYRWSFDFVAGK